MTYLPMYQHKDKGKKAVNRNAKAEHLRKVQLINTDFVFCFFAILRLFFNRGDRGSHLLKHLPLDFN